MQNIINQALILDKTCSKCLKLKSKEYFPKHGGKCKECANAYNRIKRRQYYKNKFIDKIAVENNLCVYGCGLPGQFVLKSGRNCCSESWCKCPINKQKNSEGLKKAYKEERKHNVFTELDRVNSNKKRKLNALKDFLSKNPKTRNNTEIKNIIKENNLLEWCCEECKIISWRDKEISLELDHKNGCNTDNRLNNLRLLCPNCHSQTENFRGRNINKGIKKISDEEFLKILLKNTSIHKALKEMGLTPKGANYQRAYKLLQKSTSEGI